MALSFSLLFVFFFVWFLFTIHNVNAVKAHEFKTCQQSGFCRRQKAYAQFQTDFSSTSSTSTSTSTSSSSSASSPYTYYQLIASTVNSEPAEGHFQVDLQKWISGVPLLSDQPRLIFHLYTLPNQMIRFRLVDSTDTRPIFPLSNYVFQEPYQKQQLKPVPFTLSSSPFPFSVDLKLSDPSFLIRIHYKPFKVEAFFDNQVVFTLNDHQWLHFETGKNYLSKEIVDHYASSKETHSSKKSETTSDSTDIIDLEHVNVETHVKQTSGASSLEKLHEIFNDGAFEETFNSFTDSKPYGPRSFGIDYHFPVSNHVFGLAEHTTDLDLPSTTGPNRTYSSPYRLYNLDVFEYELNSTMALYGSIPYLHLTSNVTQIGLIQFSASEMWIDIDRSSSPGISTHWMVESNPMDTFVWFAPSSLQLHQTYLHLTGLPYLPPLFALGYHQSRWNYVSVDHVRKVDADFDALEFDIPYDVMWLDIEHTNEKRYFTWDPVKFKDHALMIQELKQKHRNLVTIIDPHIKVDSNYFVSKEANEADVFVKTKDRSNFHGHCWSGDSNWIDFTQQKAVDLWIQFFSASKNPQGIEAFTWNDMNEPSVFSGPEITLPKDTLHGPYEHRDVHNIYGTLFHQATMLGQLNRASLRPFVLSRAFFLGTQKFGAVWTGDNMATWGHLEATLPMLLSLSMSGIHFCGADVGGFFGNPENELMVRWYQTAALQPFFRGHGHIETKYREPYLFPDHALIKQAIQLRYRLLPMLYTVFAHQTIPPMLPLMFVFPNDPNAVRQDVFLIGLTGILVAPVTQHNTFVKEVYFPGHQPWYTLGSHYEVKQPGQSYSIAAPLSSLPIFVQGGHVLFTRDRIRRTAELTLLDPISVYIFLNDVEESEGELIYDDGKTLHPGRLHVKGRYQKGLFTGTLQVSHQYKVPSLIRIERIQIIHPTKFTKAPLVGHLLNERVCEIKEPQLHLSMTQWRLRIFAS